MSKPKSKLTPRDVFRYVAMRNGNRSVCWPWNGFFVKQRPTLKLQGKNQNACRIVYKLVNGEHSLDDENGNGTLLVRHTCDNGAYPVGCCNPFHMQPGTHQDNMDDMVERERTGLPHKYRREILELLANGHKQHEIAAIYSVSRETISALANKRVRVNKEKEHDHET